MEWKPVSLYIDLNPGVNRTGIEQGRKQEIASVASLILRSGIVSLDCTRMKDIFAIRI